VGPQLGQLHWGSEEGQQQVWVGRCWFEQYGQVSFRLTELKQAPQHTARLHRRDTCGRQGRLAALAISSHAQALSAS
jgi:hypothetical protein